MDTKRDLSGGGSNYFKVGDGQTARVRFLYSKIDDIIYDGLLVHVLKPEVTGQRYNVEVLCNASSDETAKDECKWCKQEFSTVGRYPLALYNEGTKQVEYWSKSKSWVEKSLFTILENTVGEGQPISGQVYKIIRELVHKLQGEDREVIMLYFGFYNNRHYKQHEIATKLNISQAKVSRIIKKTINSLINTLIEQDVIETTTKQLNSRKRKRNK